MLLQTFYNLPSPKHNSKDLHSFLIEYHKVREQMRNITNVDLSTVIKSTVVRKLSLQTYEAICDYYRSYDISLSQMDVTLNYMANKFEHAVLVMGVKTNIKSVEAKTQQNQKARNCQFNCSYCKGDHGASDCTKYETLNARRDRVIAQHLCFNCLGVGHSSKNCKSPKTCRICHPHHHTSLCNQQTTKVGSKSNYPTPSLKGQTSHARSSSGNHAPSHPYPLQQQQQKPTTTQGKSNTTPKTQGSSSQSVTNVNLAQTSSLTSNVLPTATLDLCYFNEKLNTRVFSIQAHNAISLALK